MSSVLIVVFDGLQPSQVTPRRMPNLAAFASSGVAFQDHHAVFPTVTRVNAVSMLTGRYPGGHGLTANNLVVREFDPDRAIPAMRPQLAEVTKKTGKLLLAPTWPTSSAITARSSSRSESAPTATPSFTTPTRTARAAPRSTPNSASPSVSNRRSPIDSGRGRRRRFRTRSAWPTLLGFSPSTSCRNGRRPSHCSGALSPTARSTRLASARSWGIKRSRSRTASSAGCSNGSRRTAVTPAWTWWWPRTTATRPSPQP